MSPIGIAFGLVMALILANQLVMRVGSFWRVRWVFLALEALNAGTAAGILVFGLPGFEGFPAARYPVAVVFLFRVVWNWHVRSTTLWNERREDLALESARQRRWLQGVEE